MAEMKIVRNEKGVFLEFKDADMTDRAVMCGALQQTIGLEAYKRGMSMDDVRDNIIYQKRKPIKLTSKTNDNDDTVFMKDQFIWGADGRSNAGYGFWQMAYGSTGTTSSKG